MSSTIRTVGHSTRPLGEFLGLLTHYQLGAVADVRRFPGSRRCPHYAEAALGGRDELPELAGQLRTTLMCAEAVWRRCHRSLIADELRIVRGRLSYAPADADEFQLVSP